MKIIVAAVLMLSMLFVAISQISKNRKQSSLVEEHMKISPIVLLSVTSVILSDILAYGNSVSLYMLFLDMLPSVVLMWLAASSFAEVRIFRHVTWLVLISNLLLFSFHICHIADLCGAFTDRQAVMLVSVSGVFLFVFLMWLLADRMRNVKSIMKNGVVWAVVCLVVDVVYMCFVVAAIAFVQLGMPMLGILLLGGVLAAVGIRIATDSKFLIWRRQERIIIESMKITPLPAANDASRIDEVYKDLYGRVVSYFESERPYLDSELTINVVVKKLYSNKLYLSRSISQFTGRNFCQFVNYYRVMYSMESFRENPDLKIHELAIMCGFNTVVSFNMAFRLFMGENPSEWCRKERSRLIKTEK